MEAFEQNHFTKGIEDVEDDFMEKKSLFFRQIYDKCITKFTPREMNFFRGWISSVLEANKSLTKINKGNKRKEEKEEPYLLDHINPKIFQPQKLKEKEGSIHTIKKIFPQSQPQLPKTHFKKRILTSATQRAAERQQKTYFNAAEALSCFRQFNITEKQIEKRNKKIYPMFSGEKMLKKRLGLIENLQKKKSEQKIYSLSKILSKKIKQKYYERKLDEVSSFLMGEKQEKRLKKITARSKTSHCKKENICTKKLRLQV